jgi:hypothetical protein
MKTRRICLLPLLLALATVSPGPSAAEDRFDELRVRHILTDISHGGPVSYYAAHTEDSHSVEAVRRWRQGVRVLNADRFERKTLQGTWVIVFAETERPIDPRDVWLTTDEARVRSILVDITHGGPLSYYAAHPHDPLAVEAVRRWRNGVRVSNPERFERRSLDGQWALVYAGTRRTIDTADIRLTTDR